MEILILVAVGTLVYALAAIAFPRLIVTRRDASATALPYRSCKPLDVAERALHVHLASTLPECLVLTHVWLTRFLEIHDGHDLHEWLIRLEGKSVDFLICAPDCSPILAVDIDDGSIDSAAQRANAEFKARALRDAGVPLHRFHPHALPPREALRQLVFERATSDRNRTPIVGSGSSEEPVNP